MDDKTELRMKEVYDKLPDGERKEKWDIAVNWAHWQSKCRAEDSALIGDDLGLVIIIYAETGLDEFVC